MTVSKYGQIIHIWRVSTARKGYITPRGTYRPTRLHRMWYSRKYDMSPMPYSVFYHGGYAIHGTGDVKQLGRPASHGCVRLATANAAHFYSLVKEVGPKQYADHRRQLSGRALAWSETIACTRTDGRGAICTILPCVHANFALTPMLSGIFFSVRLSQAAGLSDSAGPNESMNVLAPSRAVEASSRRSPQDHLLHVRLPLRHQRPHQGRQDPLHRGQPRPSGQQWRSVRQGVGRDHAALCAGAAARAADADRATGLRRIQGNLLGRGAGTGDGLARPGPRNAIRGSSPSSPAGTSRNR